MVARMFKCPLFIEMLSHYFRAPNWTQNRGSCDWKSIWCWRILRRRTYDARPLQNATAARLCRRAAPRARKTKFVRPWGTPWRTPVDLRRFVTGKAQSDLRGNSNSPPFGFIPMDLARPSQCTNFLSMSNRNPYEFAKTSVLNSRFFITLSKKLFQMRLFRHSRTANESLWYCLFRNQKIKPFMPGLQLYSAFNAQKWTHHRREMLFGNIHLSHARF